MDGPLRPNSNVYRPAVINYEMNQNYVCKFVSNKHFSCRSCEAARNKSLLASFWNSVYSVNSKLVRVSVGDCLERVTRKAKYKPDDKYLKHTSSKPGVLKISLWNSQSLKNKLNTCQDYRDDHDLDCMFFTESWLKEDDTVAIGQLENQGYYKFITKPRYHRAGGGIGCLFKSNIRMAKVDTQSTRTFEHLVLRLNNMGKTINILIIYRPEPSANNYYTMSEFFTEFSNFVAPLHIENHELLILGDFNFHMNKPHMVNVAKFNEILDMFDLMQHVTDPTHNAGNILDLVITRKNSSLLHKCEVDELLSDHYSILIEANLGRTNTEKKVIKFRKTRNINLCNFKKDIADHLSAIDFLDEEQGPEYLKALIDIYESCVTILDKHAPIQERMVTMRKSTPWNSGDIKELKSAKRKAEKKWRKTKSEADYIYLKRNEISLINY